MIEIFTNNRYTRIYLSIIDGARHRVIGLKGHDCHHIIPKSFYKSYSSSGWLDGDHDDLSNLVMLTPREHVFCHSLLARRMTTGLAKGKMTFALKTMLGKNSNLKIVNSKTHAIILQEIRSFQNEIQNRPEVKLKNSSGVKKAFENPEMRKRHSDGLKRSHSNFDVKEKHRAAVKEAQNRPEVKAKNSKAQKERQSTPESKQKSSIIQKEVQNRPEVKAKIRAAIEEFWASSEHPVYSFIHKDGAVETCSRYQFTAKHNIDIRPLFKSKPSKTVKGWRLYVPT